MNAVCQTERPEASGEVPEKYGTKSIIQTVCHSEERGISASSLTKYSAHSLSFRRRRNHIT